MGADHPGVLQTAPVITRPELYCIVPRELDESLVPQLQAALGDHGIKVIVERRNLDAATPYEVRRQRALHLPRALPELPAELAGHAALLTLVQRMPSPGLTFADETLPEVVAAVRAGDAIAASELVWRMHARVCTRLGQRHGQVVGVAMTDTAMGAMLDSLEDFRGHGDPEFLHWLDRLVDSL